MYNSTMEIEKLFAGQLNTAYTWYINAPGTQHFAIDSLYLRTIRDNYIQMYKEFITQLHIYAKTIRILAKGYLPISLIMPIKLKEILDAVKATIQKTNPDYDLVIKRLHLYYDMKLVIFGIDRDRNLIIQLPIFIQPYTQHPLVLYQIEIVPVLIVDLNTETDSYMYLQVNRPYIALNTETYITIRQQKLRICKRIGYGFYCEEFFIMKHMSKYSCKSAIYFDIDAEIIKENCRFTFYYNKTDITLTVLDGGNEIILTNWQNNKHIICSINNDIPVRIPSHPYVLVNRSVLCNCGIEVKNNFLLESLAVCHDSNPKLVMYFMVNTAFVNYLDQIDNLTGMLEFLIVKNKTTFEQTLLISLNVSKFDSDLLTTPKKEMFDLTERKDNMDENLPNRNFFSNNFIVDVFLFIAVIISLLVTTLAIYLLFKHENSEH